jgi:hypothetical protein
MTSDCDECRLGDKSPVSYLEVIATIATIGIWLLVFGVRL